MNQASVDEYGPYRAEPSYVTTSASEVRAAVSWRVNRYSEPDVRIPSVGVDVLNLPDVVIPDVLAADIGTRLTLPTLPSQAPSTSADYFVEGTTETITGTAYAVAFNVSPVGADVFILDSSALDGPDVLAY